MTYKLTLIDIIDYLNVFDNLTEIHLLEVQFTDNEGNIFLISYSIK